MPSAEYAHDADVVSSEVPRVLAHVLGKMEPQCVLKNTVVKIILSKINEILLAADVYEADQRYQLPVKPFRSRDELNNANVGRNFRNCR